MEQPKECIVLADIIHYILTQSWYSVCIMKVPLSFFITCTHCPYTICAAMLHGQAFSPPGLWMPSVSCCKKIHISTSVLITRLYLQLCVQNVPWYEIMKWSFTGRKRNWIYTHTQGIYIYMVQLNVVSHRADKQERGAVNGSKTVTCASGSPQLLNVLPVLFLTSLGKKSERHFWTTKCCLATTTLLEVKVTTPHSRPTTPQQKINALDSDFDPAWKPGMTKMYSHCGSFFIYFSTVNREEYEM